MAPRPETCVDLIRPVRALSALKHAAMQRIGGGDRRLQSAAVALLAELMHRGECRACDLAQHRVVDASVVSRQVTQLEREGLIRREPDPSDRRVSLLSVTPEGEQALLRVRRRQSEWLSEALHDWDDQQVRQLADTLALMSDDIRRAVLDRFGPDEFLTGKEGDDDLGSGAGPTRPDGTGRQGLRAR